MQVIFFVIIVGIAIVVASMISGFISRSRRLWQRVVRDVGIVLGSGLVAVAALQVYLQFGLPLTVHSMEVRSEIDIANSEWPGVELPGEVCVKYVASKRRACPARVWVYITPESQPPIGGILISHTPRINVPRSENRVIYRCYTIDEDDSSVMGSGKYYIDAMFEHTCPSWWGFGQPKTHIQFVRGAKLKKVN